MTAATGRRRLPRLLPRLAMPGITAIGVKELRGRMRGKRAFISVTVYVILVAGFAWMVGRILEENAQNQMMFGGGFNASVQSAGIGRGIFIALMFLQTLMILVLAPASTAGTISSEREKQTLDLLAVTPISSVAIVVGKLLSALTWVFVLILASIPVTALVFVYGGVAPDDVIRGYVMLFVTAIAFGALGTFFSSLLRRSGAATGMTFVAVLISTVGLSFIWVFMNVTSQSVFARRPPEALFYLNPFVAQADVACGAEASQGSWCQIIDTITGTFTDFGVQPGFDGQPGGGVIIEKGIAVPERFVPDAPLPDVQIRGDVGFGGNANVGGVVVNDVLAVDPLAAGRDRYWPRSALTLMLLAVGFTAAAVQLVTPTRRWRPRLPGIPRRRRTGRSAE
ncbi:MAG: ABC transporter permease [Chloroflexota bacterium]|nr:MAG: ABC transporter permease [Chloroflexota bacterium]